MASLGSILLLLLFTCSLSNFAVESLPSVTELKVDKVTFPAKEKPVGSTKTLFLGGAGVRGMEIEGKFTKFTAIGVYLEDKAVDLLSVEWKGKNAQQLTESVKFFDDIATGDFDKFIRVTMILPLTGPQYSEKVAENCVNIWKSLGTYTNAEEKAIQQVLNVFKDENFPPASSILFTISGQASLTSLTVGFSRDGSMPKAGKAEIQNKLLAEAVLESIIGKDGVSPATKQSLASRLSSLFI